jgi:choline dehydrogenase-like flavoprotein
LDWVAGDVLSFTGGSALPDPGATISRAAINIIPSHIISILERGPWLPREKRNWDVKHVAVKGCDETDDVWLDKNDNQIMTNARYNVGGNSKFWGAALFRLREKDFEKLVHPDGISPEWPLKYRDFEPYYTQVEKLYDVHGKRGVDPTEPPIREEYPYPPLPPEPRIQQVADGVKAQGLNPFQLPTAIRRSEDQPHLSQCIRCDTCDGFPCLVEAKADGEYNGARPALQYPMSPFSPGLTCPDCSPVRPGAR